MSDDLTLTIDTNFRQHVSQTVEFHDDKGEVFRVDFSDRKVNVIYAKDVTPLAAAVHFFWVVAQIWPELLAEKDKSQNNVRVRS